MSIILGVCLSKVLPYPASWEQPPSAVVENLAATRADSAMSEHVFKKGEEIDVRHPCDVKKFYRRVVERAYRHSSGMVYVLNKAIGPLTKVSGSRCRIPKKP